MNFEIGVETYIRLAGVTDFIRNDIPDAEKKLLRCVRVENRNGHMFALASNRKIGAVYFLGKTDEPDGAAHINIDEKLLKQCQTEKPFDSKLHIIAIKEIGIVSLKTTMGFAVGNAGFFSDETPLNHWPTWFPDNIAQESKSAMTWITEDMITLNEASPSGRVVFPKYIDAEKPVILRDLYSPDWLGIFTGMLVNDKGEIYTAEPAEYPTWWSVVS